MLQELEQREDESDDEYFEVWAENWPTLLVFLALQTQWRTDMGAFVSLDYGSAMIVMQIHEVADKRAMLADLQRMEVAAIPIINKPKG